ncbi:glycosyltransferase family 2 protein [Candidatus Falkowbacteria bacterium]|nr:glycosyltransferase family 2 protein [Candidatus Falkowbacteria bacterium]
MDLSIIIVSWNVRDKLKSNLEALFASRGNFSFEVFVVDNNSTDGTEKMVRNEFSKIHPLNSGGIPPLARNVDSGVKLIANSTNVGFARANNHVLRLCIGKARYVLLLNPDMKVFPDTLRNMIEWMDERREAAIASCRLIGENGKTIQHIRRFPTLLSQLAIILKLPHFFPLILNRYLCKSFNYDKEAVVDSMRGSFFMMRTETLKRIGLLNEKYFLWFEEVDYCKRAKKVGLKVIYTPAAKCVDLVGTSFSQIKRGAAQKYFRDSMLVYFKKWHPTWQYLILKLAWPIGAFLAKTGELANFKARAKT